MPVSGGERIEVGNSFLREEIVLERFRETFGVDITVQSFEHGSSFMFFLPASSSHAQA